MPRYYFNVINGADLPDLVGTELLDLAAARNQAIRHAGELLQDDGGGGGFWSGHEWRMLVRDDVGEEVLYLKFSAEQHG
jgi:hypothetical protein